MKLLVEIDDDGKKTSLTRWLTKVEAGGIEKNSRVIISSFGFMVKELEAVIRDPSKTRSILHIVAGDEEWEPTDGQLASITSLFINAGQDPQ